MDRAFFLEGMDRNSTVSCTPFGLTSTKSKSFASHSLGYVFEFVAAPFGDNAHQILGRDTIYASRKVVPNPSRVLHDHAVPGFHLWRSVLGLSGNHPHHRNRHQPARSPGPP